MALFVVSLSSLFAGISIVVACYLNYMLRTAEVLPDFEGRGVESPLAIIFGVGLFFLVFLLPWMIACVRSIRNIRMSNKQSL